jgi:hypothetical protein
LAAYLKTALFFNLLIHNTMTQETQNKFAAILAAAQNKANVQAQPKVSELKKDTYHVDTKQAFKELAEIGGFNTDTQKFELKPELSTLTINDLLQDAPNTTQQANIGSFDIVNYSDKAIAIFGNTKAIKEDLKAFGGRFNAFLNYNGTKAAGWVFSKAKESQLRNFISSLK